MKNYLITEDELLFLKRNLYTNFELRAAMIHTILTKVERCPSPEDSVKALRNQGYAVVFITPEDLEGTDPDHVENRLYEHSVDVIAGIVARDVALGGL